MKFITQQQDSTCFPTALVNCGIYLGIKVNLKKMIKITDTNHGKAIYVETAIKESKLPLVKTRSYNRVCSKGGIITIMHPLFNFHAVFVYPEGKENVFVNSWLASNIFKTVRSEIKEYLPKWKHQRKMWYIEK